MPKTSARLLSLLSLLQARRDWPGQLLAERLEVSPRTVRRDIDRLRDLGYPIRTAKGPDGGYRLGAGSELPPLLFDDEQAVALAVALRTASVTGAGIEEGAVRALTTVRQVMPARLRHRVDALQVTPVERAGTAQRPQADPGVLLTLSAAVRAREVLCFAYTPAWPPAPVADTASPRPDGGPDPDPPRRVQPHHLVTWGGLWYLVAWDLDRDDWRTFRVDRIDPRTPTGPRFTPREVPGGDVPAFVAGRFRGSEPRAGTGTGGSNGSRSFPDPYGSNGSGAQVRSVDWPCRGEVILDLPAAVVSGYASDGVVEELGPHRCRLVLGSWSWAGLAATVARFDTEIRVVGPPELADAFARLARRCARAASLTGTDEPAATNEQPVSS
ncbi:helix-turn-helix transcriptional regulator [Streptomyces sp. NPDC005548]|uniref:helix-turn-helix transcriptional regulator n=1 Tax=Streptomyces sp. NPDC005548 TaxID=3364724 RepID=UPI00367F944D